MADTCNTVKIVASHKSQGDYVEINEEDFDKSVHKPYKPKAEAEAPKPDAE